MPDPAGRDLADRLKAEAAGLSFDLVGIAPAVPAPGHPDFLAWLDRGNAAGMGYLRKHAEARRHPASIVDGVRSVVMAGVIYGHPEAEPEAPTRGKVARYARGRDYHDWLWDRLGRLLDWLRAEVPEVRGRAVADTAPLLERDFARLAGLGWIGKNTMLISRRAGSFTLLGALLVDLELPPDEPHATSHCGTCTRCLDACPTGAFDGPYQLDARRCISYWTIEHKGPLSAEAAEALDGWAFGCDVCQDVCPWNRKAPPGRAPELDAPPGWSSPDLIAWLGADPAAFRQSIKGTALARAKRSGLLRNASALLGSRRVVEAVPALAARLRDDDPVVRDAAARALIQIGTAEARSALASVEGDADPNPTADATTQQAREANPPDSADRGGPVTPSPVPTSGDPKPPI